MCVWAVVGLKLKDPFFQKRVARWARWCCVAEMSSSVLK